MCIGEEIPCQTFREQLYSVAGKHDMKLLAGLNDGQATSIERK